MVVGLYHIVGTIVLYVLKKYERVKLLNNPDYCRETDAIWKKIKSGKGVDLEKETRMAAVRIFLKENPNLTTIYPDYWNQLKIAGFTKEELEELKTHTGL